MSPKQLILTSTAVMTIALSGALLAQTASDQAAAASQAQDRKDVATDVANQQPPGTAARKLDLKVDEATAADAQYHADRTEPNRLARDRAEAAAAAAAGMAHDPDSGGR